MRFLPDRDLPNPFSNCKVVGENVTDEEYLRQEVPRGDPRWVMQRSELMQCYWSPSKWLAGIPNEPTKAMKFGSVVDCLLLTPELFKKRYAVCPEFYMGKRKHARKDDPLIEKPWNSNAKTCEDWEEEQQEAGLVCVSFKIKTEAEKAIKRAMQKEEFSEVIANSKKQVLVTGEYRSVVHKVTFPVKSLLDLVPSPYSLCGKSVLDLKTAVDASEEAWNKAVFYQEYDIQSAMHLDMYREATKEERTEVRHIIIENTEPFEPALRIMNSTFLNLGRGGLMAALERYAECLALKRFPSYEDLMHDTYQGWGFSKPQDWMAEQRALM